jgi:uncharacterized phage protein (TIGR01671 family)
MNREIKFRAWDKTYNLMNYKVMVGNTDHTDTNYTCNGIWVDYADAKRNGWMSVDDKGIELMQYTGFKDVNGKEIYEGDVLQVTYIDVVEPTGVGVINSVVSFENGMFVCKDEGFDYEGKKEQPMSLYEWMKGEQVTIIRNIYER